MGRWDGVLKLPLLDDVGCYHLCSELTNQSNL